MKRTTAPGSLSGQYIDFESTPEAPGTLLTAEDRNLVQEEICSPIEGASIALSGSDNGQLFKAIKKIVVEKSKHVGELFWHQERKDPVAWSAGAPDAYFPAICLTSIGSYLDISSTNWPLLVPYLRSLQLKYKDGLPGEAANFLVTGITKSATGIVELAFTGGSEVLCKALYEDYIINGTYTNYRSITLNQDIFSDGDLVVAGTYPITNINPIGTISFDSGVPGTATSFDLGITISMYPYRISGSSTTARIFSLKGLTLHGQGDENEYFFNAIRRRGYFQSHFHSLSAGPSVATASTSVYGVSNSNTITFESTNAVQGGAKHPIENANDAAGVPRSGKETHSPCMVSHIYMHGGKYVV